MAENAPLESAKNEISKKVVGFNKTASNIVIIEPVKEEINTFLKSRSPLKKLIIISENTVKSISIRISLTNHLCSRGMID